VALIKEFECIEHGVFESSHPICPNFGCESRSVAQVFITPPHIGTSFVKRFDAGIRRSSDLMGGANFRSAKPGEAAFGGDVGKKLGMEVLWGQDVQKSMGRNFAQLTQIAQQPLSVPGTNLRLDKNNGMRDAATDVGITKRRLPPAYEVTAAKAEKGSDAKAKALL
jgi:hypothetical protein